MHILVTSKQALGQWWISLENSLQITAGENEDNNINPFSYSFHFSTY